jgi:hypothetical protein
LGHVEGELAEYDANVFSSLKTVPNLNNSKFPSYEGKLLESESGLYNYNDIFRKE